MCLYVKIAAVLVQLYPPKNYYYRAKTRFKHKIYKISFKAADFPH